MSRQITPGPSVAVAVSGGLDSTALLHCTAHAARVLGLQVHALHVNHGLQAEASDWQRQIERQCRRWAARGLPVHFHAARIEGRPAAGESVEKWARQQRYAALARLATAQGCQLVLLAHHRGDQAETVLLQALRGAGPAGLSAMPRAAERQGIVWARPWLEWPRSALADYARRHRLGWVDDPSNASLRYARNRVRLDVMPTLGRHFSDAEQALQAVARRAQEAAAVLREVAADDAEQGLQGGALVLQRWLLLSEARRRNLLRHWLGGRTSAPVPETLIDRLTLELPGAQVADWPLPGGLLRLHAGELHPVPTAPPLQRGPASASLMDLSLAGCHRLPGWPGQMVVEAVGQGGVSPDCLRRVAVRPRGGGEQFQRAANSIPRGLKKQFQALQVPRWLRDGPLLFAGGQLLFVAGLGIDARCLAGPGEPQLSLRWLPAAWPDPRPTGAQASGD